MPIRPHVAVIASAIAAVHANAHDTLWRCSLGPASTFSQSTQIALPLAGTWIGDFDATTNPGGTRTIPGLFGGSGNNLIPFTSTVRTTAGVSEVVPSGGFIARFDPDTGRLRIGGLVLDALGTSTGSLETELVISYSTFRTVSPTSTFIGVSNLPVPFDSGSLTGLSATQTADAEAMAARQRGGTWAFTIEIPVDLTVQGEALGSPFGGTTPALLPLAGSIRVEGDALVLNANASIQDSTPVPAPPPLANVPLPLPTILPPGSTANLLMNGTFSEGTSSSALSTSLQADGTPGCAGDLDDDGTVSAADIGLLLIAFGDCAGLCPADLDGDDSVTAADIGLLLLAFGDCS